ncbi:MAG: cupredoxin domain-containing protein [Actinomycetota bacterium]
MKSSTVRIAVVAATAIALVVPAAAAEAQIDRGGMGPLGTVQRIRMVDGNRFRPVTVTVARGTRVRWVNRDNVSHTTTSNTGIWDATLSPGERFARRFRRTGEFDYRCTIHTGMRGTIIVT